MDGIKNSNISILISLAIFLTSATSFIIVNFFPIIFPELISTADSNFWPAIFVIFRSIALCLILILAPGLLMLLMINTSPTLKNTFSKNDADLHLKSIKLYAFIPVQIFCLYIAVCQYYWNYSFSVFFIGISILCLLFSCIIYNAQWKKAQPSYVIHTTFFFKKGIQVFLVSAAFYGALALCLLGLTSVILKFAPLFINGSKSKEFICFLLLLIAFTFPSLFLLIGFTRKSKESKSWIFNSALLLAIIAFIYMDWYTPLFKPSFKKYHFAFFNDVSYYHERPSCLVLEHQKISIHWLDNQLCNITEDHETTSAIGDFIILTFKNNHRITLPKPHYSVT